MESSDVAQSAKRLIRYPASEAHHSHPTPHLTTLLGCPLNFNFENKLSKTVIQTREQSKRRQSGFEKTRLCTYSGEHPNAYYQLCASAYEKKTIGGSFDMYNAVLTVTLLQLYCISHATLVTLHQSRGFNVAQPATP